ncbi:RNA polymerase sigma factor [Solibacillus sp. MA9]|uniref:RNA polymerase sigma factor n=1 Tax=Solibacillus palustris TaxID=2908203 RepID=A0ABS9U7L2_9BACL|nr:RNA polymerase sigma factor [Solibacillus sp. MA9]
MNALAKIYTELQPKLYAYFFIKTSNSAISEDLTQDVFYEATKSIHTYRGEATLSTWLFKIANNLLKKHYRKKHYEENLLTKIEAQPTLPFFTTEQLIELKDEAKRLLVKIEQLEPPLKEIVLLRILGELSFKEIGDLLELSENYVRVNFHRQKLKLQREEEKS